MNHDRPQCPGTDGETVCGRIALNGDDQNILICDIQGPESGATVIFLHGGGQSRSSWRIAAKQLGIAGFRTCTLDLRGHGDSDWSPGGDYRAERFVADLVRVILALGSPAIVVGASFGGHVSLLTAAWHPSLVKALVLCDVTPWIEGDATRAMRGMMLRAAEGYVSVHDAADHISDVRGFRSDWDPARLQNQMRKRADGRLYWRWDPKFFSDQEETAGDLTVALLNAMERLIAPTLLIRAGQSEIVTTEQVSDFCRLVPHTVYAEIASARHTVSARDNEAYAAHIIGFLSQITPASSGE